MRYVPLALTLGVILLTSTFGFNNASAATISTLSFDRLPKDPVTMGSVIIFSGRLVGAENLNGVVNATIKIIHQVAYNHNELLVTGQTDADGFYAIPWVVAVDKIAAVEGGSFGLAQGQGSDQRRFQVKLVAQFDGNDQYARSISTAQSFEARLNELKIFIDKKPVYLAFESSTIKVRVTDVDNNLVDPDKLTAFFNNTPITLSRDDVGVYSFTITSLTPGAHSFSTTATKKGFITDDDRVTIDATKRKTALSLSTDKATYNQGDTITVSAQLRDVSENKFVSGKLVTGSLIPPDLKVKSLTFVDGMATYKLTNLDAAGKWTVSANFAADQAYFSSSNSISFTVEKGTGVVKPSKPIVEEKVSLGSIGLVDQTGARLRSVSVGEQVMIQAKVTSNFATSEEIAYISQVKDADGITVALSWITGTISPGQSLELAVSWLPDVPGEYTAEVFVWKDVKTPEPLSFEVKRSTIVVK